VPGGFGLHIPDGYLGPQTCVACCGAMIPLWGWASSQVKKSLGSRSMPLLALSAAFSFVVMMINVPIPGGTSGHAVGSVLAAILFGPWAALLAVSLTLVIQALLFGDGGVTAIGANCLTMAFVMPLAGYVVFRALSIGAAAGSKRRWLAAAAAGYVGINAAALVAALLLGIQPLIAVDSANHALYCPFGLKVALPAMMTGHLLLFGWVEAAVTGAAFAYLERLDPGLSQVREGGPAGVRHGRLWTAVLALALLTPLGVLLPWLLGGGAAWGEWAPREVQEMVGYLPRGLARLAEIWRAPIPDYGGPGADGSWVRTGLWTIFSAAAGITCILAIGMALKKVFLWREGRGRPA
jgi:cobalt/nickel transport system permease protein